ncbi:unnamed protein product, partial [Prorocentrum cordatum]
VTRKAPPIGPGTAPICWTFRSRGRGGSAGEEAPDESEALEADDHWMTFDRAHVEALDGDWWLLWLSNLYRLVFPGQLGRPSPQPLEDIAARWNGGELGGKIWERWNLVQALIEGFPVATSYWMMMISTQATYRAEHEEKRLAAAAQEKAKESGDSGSSPASEEYESEDLEAAAVALRGLAGEAPQDAAEGGAGGRRAELQQELARPGPRCRGQASGKGKRGPRARAGQARRPAERRRGRAGTAAEGDWPAPGSVPAEILGPAACRLTGARAAAQAGVRATATRTVGM